LTDVRSNAPDGEIVEKGAVAQRLRAVSGASGATARTVYTESGGILAALSTGNASIAALGVADATEQSALVNWVRGQNVDDEELKVKPADASFTKGTDAMRPSVHGDVVHSRPLAIDYGDTIDVVVFYGSNDGTLRAINGNKADTDGNELWSFVAPEHYGKFKRLRSNSPSVSFPGITGVPAPTSKDYFFDGPIGVYNNGGTKWIYPTMRRGGSAVYAFDVSTPTSPALKWKRDAASTGFTNIGQTWSEPKVVKVTGYLGAVSGVAEPVIIMGGGYDPCEDQDAVSNTD
jgi:type IV pilus assembly protein PilY1